MADKEKYEQIMDRLRKKLKKGQLSNREDGYNDGILCAMSMIKDVYGNEPDNNSF